MDGARFTETPFGSFVPPPPDQLGQLLSDLERFIHEEPRPPATRPGGTRPIPVRNDPPLPRRQRRGRTRSGGVSPYFEARRDEYYDALQGVRERGDIDRWVALFLDGVRAQTTDAVARAERLTDLRERCRADVRAVTRGAANRLVDLAFEQPVLNARFVERRLGITGPAALAALRQLADLGIVVTVGEGPGGQLRWRADEALSVLTAE